MATLELTPDETRALYDFLVADWIMFAAYMGQQNGWPIERCQALLAQLADASIPEPATDA